MVYNKRIRRSEVNYRVLKKSQSIARKCTAKRNSKITTAINNYYWPAYT